MVRFRTYFEGRAHRICSWIKSGAWGKEGVKDGPRILTRDLEIDATICREGKDSETTSLIPRKIKCSHGHINYI